MGGYGRYRRARSYAQSVRQSDKDRGAPVSFTPTTRTGAHDRNIWSCLRNGANNAWNGNGNNGYLNNNNFYNSNQAVPVANYHKVKNGNL